MDVENGHNFDVLCDLIQNGGVVKNAVGSCADEIFESISKAAQLPETFDRQSLSVELSQREKILSTAVGHGFAIPHPRKSILKSEDDQRIIVCYPEKAVDMSSPDGTHVTTMFVLLTKSTQIHLDALANLAKLVHCVEFRQFIETKPGVAELVEKIKVLQSQGIIG